MTCPRCRGDFVGFCSKCYLELYGVNEDNIIDVPIDELICSEKHLQLVERDTSYTDEIRQSIIEKGYQRDNPLIIDSKNRILIGHHRYFICKGLDFETIPCYRVEKTTNYNKFIEGGVNNIFIVKIDGKIEASVMQVEQLVPIMKGWILRTPFWKTSYMNVECFTGIGGTNDPENWKALEKERVAKVGKERNLDYKKGKKIR